MTENNLNYTNAFSVLDALNTEIKQTFSRQLNKMTMTESELFKVFNMRTVLIGVSSNCSEIVKNLLRNGSKTIFIHDESIVEQIDIRNNYFFSESDIGHRKDETLKKYNPTIQILKREDLEINSLKALSITSIVVTKLFESNFLEKLNSLANELQVPYILSCQLGLSFFIFSDFGKTQSQVQGEEFIYHLPIQRYFSEETTIDKMFNLSTYNEKHMETFTLLRTVIEYQKQFDSLPKLFNQVDSDQFFSFLNDIAQKIELDFSQNKETFLRFAQTLRLEIPLVAEISGALTASEVLKTVISRFVPINQVLFWENFQLLEALKMNEQETIRNVSPQFFDYQLLLGEEMMSSISNLKILLVGCGAVGCEQVKNLYQMGACRGEKGHLYLVDDDLIERSNLPRQVLFTEDDVKKNKAQTCKNWLMKKDPLVKVTSYDILVYEKNENIFNYDFFESIDIIIIAVDSVEARHYLADKAIKHKKFLVESATNGFEAQSQSQVPYLSAKIDIAQQQEINIQSCTIRSALNNVGNSLTYAKTIFAFEFSCLRESDGTFLKNKDLKNFKDMYLKMSDNSEFCDQVLRLQVEKIFNQMFYYDVIQIGNTFNPIRYDQSNPDHTEFVQSLFSILKKYINNAILNKSTLSQQLSQQTTQNEHLEQSKYLPTFDKDDLDHGNLVYQISKLRSNVFNIPYDLERYEAIGKIGNIIPAILESTSVASGFALLELFTWLTYKEEIRSLFEKIQELNIQEKEIHRKQQIEEQNEESQNIKVDPLIQQEQQQTQDPSNRNDLYISQSNIEDFTNQFNKFGFKETFGFVSSPITLARSMIQFKLAYLNCLKLQVNSNLLFKEIVVKINEILSSNHISQSYIIEFEGKMIYREDIETSKMVAPPTKVRLTGYLEANFLHVIQSTLERTITDTNFVLVIYNSKVNLIKQLEKRDKIAEIYLSLINYN